MFTFAVWCLMMQSPEQLAPDCVRTFESEGWCVFDLKDQVETYRLINIRLWCEGSNDEEDIKLSTQILR